MPQDLQHKKGRVEKIVILAVSLYSTYFKNKSGIAMVKGTNLLD